MPKIHRLADVQSKSIGKETFVWQFAVVLEGAKIGNNCNINCHTFIENDVIVGNNVTIKSGVYLWDGLRIEDNVFLGPNVTFTNDMVPRSKKYPETFLVTRIKKGASIGANTTILAGLEIGEYGFIGAGSVLTKNVPPFTVWYGNPATHRGYITKGGVLLDLTLTNKAGQKFQYIKNEIIKK